LAAVREWGVRREYGAERGGKVGRGDRGVVEGGGGVGGWEKGGVVGEAGGGRRWGVGGWW